MGNGHVKDGLVDVPSFAGLTVLEAQMRAMLENRWRIREGDTTPPNKGEVIEDLWRTIANNHPNTLKQANTGDALGVVLDTKRLSAWARLLVSSVISGVVAGITAFALFRLFPA